MQMEWSEEKFLKGIVGDKRRLSFWNKNQKIELLFTQLARYNRMHERVLKYQKTIQEKYAKWTQYRTSWATRYLHYLSEEVSISRH